MTDSVQCPGVRGRICNEVYRTRLPTRKEADPDRSTPSGATPSAVVCVTQVALGSARSRSMIRIAIGASLSRTRFPLAPLGNLWLISSRVVL